MVIGSPKDGRRMSESGYPHYLRLIGLMGYSSREENITLFLAALRELLRGNNSR